jgi:YVTN family beta-propeller protein
LKFRSRKILGLLVALLLASAGCGQKFLLLKPPLTDEGELYIYLQPMSQDSEKLQFTVSGLEAVKEDGTETPLNLSFTEFNGAALKTQKLLAYGRLAPGNYVGILVKVDKASIKAKDGEASLLTPEKPVNIDARFTIVKKEAVLLNANFDYGKSVSESFSFTPGFTFLPPGKTLENLLGYVSNYGADNLTIFNKLSRQVTGVLATGRGPLGLAIDQAGERLYIAASGDDEVEIVDIRAGRIVNRVKLNNGDSPQELVLTPDKRQLLVTDKGSDTVSVIDTSSMAERSRIPVGQAPVAIVMDKAGRRAYVFNNISNTISVIDVANSAVAATIATDSSPIRGDFSPAGDKLYVIQSASPYLTVLDVASLSVTNRIFVGLGLSGIKVDQNTGLIYVAKKDESRVFILDPALLIPLDYMQTASNVSYMAIDDENNNMFLLLPDEKAVQAARITGRQPLPEFDVLESPYFIVMMGERF